MQIPPKLMNRATAALTRVMDRNHDGTVSETELKNFAKSSTFSPLNALRLMRELIRGGPAAKLSPDASAAFKASLTRVVDRNHDGFVSSDEAAAAQKGDPLKFVNAVKADLAKNGC